MKKIEAWKTSDGKVWETKYAAEKHNRELVMASILNDLYYHGMIECGDHLLDFLVDHKPIILQYYGIEEK